MPPRQYFAAILAHDGHEIKPSPGYRNVAEIPYPHLVWMIYRQTLDNNAGSDAGLQHPFGIPCSELACD